MISFLAKSAVIYGAIDAFTKSLSVVAVLVLSNLFAPAQIGTLELMLSLAAFVGMVSNFGLNNASHRFYWDKPNNEHRYAIVTSGFIAMVLTSTMTCTFAAALYKFWGHNLDYFNLKINFYVFSSILFYGVLIQILGYLQDVARLKFSPRRFFLIALFSKFLSVLISLIAIKTFGFGIEHFIVIQVFVFFLVLPLCVSFVWQDFDLKCVNIRIIRRMTKFGFPFIFSSFSYWLLGSTDRWMLSMFTNLDDVATYSIAFRMGLILTIVTTGIGLAWSPVAMKIRNDYPKDFKAIYGEVLCVIILIMYFFVHAIGLFSLEIFSAIFDEFYVGSVGPYLFLSFGMIFLATTQVTALGLGIAERTGYLAVGAMSTAVINAILNYFFIPKYGPAGAAFASMASYFFMTCVYYLWSQRYSPIFVNARLFNLILTYCFSSGCVALIVVSFGDSIIIQLSKSILIITTFSLSILFISRMDIFKKRDKFQALMEIN